jgi:glycosyltransferase involved in cell wall biosynthesis
MTLLRRSSRDEAGGELLAMSRPLISIVTPSYNQAPFIRRTIDSVLSQRGDFELEYRIVDGASSDETLRILESYGAALNWVSERDQGQVDAINKGLRACNGEIVGWVNSDDTLLKGALGRVAEAFATHPRSEWLHGRCEIIDVGDQPVRAWISRYKHLRAKRHSFENLLTENYVSQMTCFWRRAVHDQIGYLDPNLKLAFDYDFWLRLAKRGDPLYLAEKLACFRWYETSKSGAQFRAQFAEDARVAERHAPSGKPGILLRKRLKNVAIVGIYDAMARVRALAQATRRTS